MEPSELIQQLSNTGNALWEASLKQNSVAVIQCIIGFGVTLAMVIAGAFVLRWARKHDEDNPYNDYLFPALMLEGIIVVVFIISTVLIVMDIITIINNPEWAAAQRIIDAIKD